LSIIQAFAQQFQKKGWLGLQSVKPVSYTFSCKHYSLCLQQ
jgi:adenosine deaminase CECR1